jgi:hypothetical protein
MAEKNAMEVPQAAEGPVDRVLLIDGDNDPHLPPDFPLTQSTLVRVFLRQGAAIPRGLERRLAALPMCVSVVSPKGGKNSADFVMSLHAGLLHAILHKHVPFTLVTADKSLSAMAQELQRLGRLASLWTSHPERGRARAQAPAKEPRQAPARRTRGRAKAPPASPPPAAAPSLEETARTYLRRLAAIKDPPGRLKALLNDIKNRSGASGHPPEAVLESLKRSGALTVDDKGRVRVSPQAPEAEGDGADKIN